MSTKTSIPKSLWKTYQTNDEASALGTFHDLLPHQDNIREIIALIRQIFFPGFFSSSCVLATNLEKCIHEYCSNLSSLLSVEIKRALASKCLETQAPCVECQQLAQKKLETFFDGLGSIRVSLKADLDAAIQGDPAAKNKAEVILSYPGFYAITIYRVAHALYHLEIPLLPRIMTEQAHTQTGIDIHPGAKIDSGFFIDHGTGVVIGETTRIGKNVRVYQGVTLGALSLHDIDGVRFQKRHPTIEHDVIIYAGATILGGQTTIGHGSTIGGNTWITESIVPQSRVMHKKLDLSVQTKNHTP